MSNVELRISNVEGGTEHANLTSTFDIRYSTFDIPGGENGKTVSMGVDQVFTARA